MKVEALMHRDPATLRPESTCVEAAMLMKREDCGSLPIVKDGKLVGIVTDRDIVLRTIAAKKDPAQVAVSEIMTGARSPSRRTRARPTQRSSCRRSRCGGCRSLPMAASSACSRSGSSRVTSRRTPRAKR